MMKVAIIGRHLGNLSVDRLQVPRWQDGGGAVVRGRREKKSREKGCQREQEDIERLEIREGGGESGTAPSAV